MIEKVMRGSVKMLVDQGWDGVKLDSCSQFHNLTHWAELINQVRVLVACSLLHRWMDVDPFIVARIG